MSVLDHRLISQRYFFPRRERIPNPTWVEADGARLACHSASNGHPLVVVHFHGNGEVVADYSPGFVEALDYLGADTFLAEYRGYGESTGTPTLGRMLEDVEAIYEAVDRPPEEIVVFGRSVGSIYAIEFAKRYPEVAGLVLESGIADPLERILLRASPRELGVSHAQMEQAFSERLDHSAKLAGRRRPTLVMHCRYDALVDVSHAVRLASSPAENVRLVIFHEGNHNTIFARNRRQYLDELGKLFQMIREGRPYGSQVDRQPIIAGGADLDDTLEGGFIVPEKTDEYDSLAPARPRTGPGQTSELNIPDRLRPVPGRRGPDDTFEMEKPTPPTRPPGED